MTKLVLIGDSLRLHYQPLVAEALGGVVEVWGPAANCQSSREILANAQAWIGDARPDIVHMNCGMHDLRIDPSSLEYNVPIEVYARHLEALFSLVTRRSGAQLIWATLTPLHERRHQQFRPAIRRQRDVAQYNELALSLPIQHGARINDLHRAVTAADQGDLLGQDGLHFTSKGYRFLADQVVSAVRTALRRDA